MPITHDAVTKTARFNVLPLALMISLSLGMSIVTIPASMAAETAQSSAEIITYRITAGSLDHVLNQFAVTAGIELSIDAQLTQGKTSPGLTGQFSAEQGLQKLLSEHNLNAVHSGSNVYTIKVNTSKDNEEINLPVVKVSADRESAWAPIDGYLASNTASVNKTDTPLLETARSVTVVTADQIRDRKVQTVEDALRYTAGVQVSGSGHDPRFDQINIRGFSVTTDADFRDGLRQFNTGWLSYYRTEPYGLERIDVVKGPNSVLFGQLSPGGMVNRVSKRPVAESIREAEVQAGTDDHYQGQFDLAGKLSEDESWLYRVVGLARDSKSDIEGVIDDNRYFAPSITWQPSDQTSLTLLNHFQDYETAGSPRPLQLPSGELSHFWAGDEKFDLLEQKQYVTGYEFKHRFNDTVSFRQNLRYGRVETDNQYTLSSLQADGRTVSRTAYGIYEHMNTLTMDTALQTNFSTGDWQHSLTMGVDYADLTSRVRYLFGPAPSIDMLNPDYNQDIATPTNAISDSKTDAQQLGLYAQDQINWNNWRLSLGLRRDKAERDQENYLTSTKTDADNSATTGSAGLLYLFDSGVAPYISFATSFVPQFGSNISGDTYEPTEGEQWEVGLKYQPVGYNSLLTVSLFDLTQKNVLTTDPANIANQIQKGERQSRGVELEATTSLDFGLDLVANYTYQDVEISKSNDGDQGKKAVGIPKQMASIWGNYAFQTAELRGLELGMGVRWVGESYADSANTLKNDAYTIADARLAYRLDNLINGATIAVNASNLNNEEYLMCNAGYCYRGLGRTVITSFNYNW
ncbi:TonB-dependent siderophore receptor [Methylophaga nitratireducenticrescens]|uniref:Ferrichrome-iron receptor n=1 Tax=Methylophaga nitratireducenticrescens TaxID=754476 RepID=I1XF75_METNJ|nr:TonB-dependent siderophore receptor [Methylophaga nitratireducenticrescens]AFI83044.1 TonB-dependent siderophore receptor [Methylophaga nitratireducenticrescens]